MSPTSHMCRLFAAVAFNEIFILIFTDKSAVESFVHSSTQGCRCQNSEEAYHLWSQRPTSHIRWRTPSWSKTRWIHLGHRRWQNHSHQFRKGNSFVFLLSDLLLLRIESIIGFSAIHVDNSIFWTFDHSMCGSFVNMMREKFKWNINSRQFGLDTKWFDWFNRHFISKLRQTITELKKRLIVKSSVNFDL